MILKKLNYNINLAKIIFLLIVFFLFATFVLAIPYLGYVSPTLANLTFTPNSSVLINVSINESSLGSLIYNWNGTNFTLYNNSLIFFMNFDNVSSLGEGDSSNRTIDISSRNITANCSNMPSGCNYSVGKYGNAIGFDGVDDYVITNVPKPTLPFTICFWINPNSVNPVGIFDSASGQGDVLRNYNSGYVEWWDQTPSVSMGLSAGVWTHLCFEYSHDGTNRIINWTKNGVRQTAGSAAGTSNFAWTTFRIGDINNGVSGRFAGYLDNFMIWNRSLNNAEIYQLYVSNLNKFNSSKWYLYVNQSKNATNVLTDGTYTYQVFATNSSGSLNSSDLRTLSVDTTYPQVNFTLPTPGNSTGISGNSIPINISFSELNLNELKYNWNSTNYTMYNDSLVLMMNFENLSSLGENSTYIVDVSKYSNNGTTYGPVVNSSSGKYGNGVYLDGVNDYIDINSGSNLNMPKGYSISVWIKPYINASLHAYDYQRIIRTTDDNQVLFFRKSTGNLEHKGLMTGSEVRTLGSWNNFSAGRWSFITIVTNLTNRYMYVDGNLITSSSYTNGGAFSSTFDWEIGNSAYSFNGSVDEVKIWNRSLSSDEVYQQYVSNLQKFNSTQWNLYVNQSKNATNGLSPGIYTYQAYVQDFAGNFNSTEQKTNSIISPPQINFTFPTPANNTYTNNTNVSINVSISSTGLSNLTYNWNGTNYTIYNDSLILMMNFENLSSLGENSTYAVDVSKYSNNGTLSETVINSSSGKYGWGAWFDGVNDNITLANEPNFDFERTSAISGCAWIYPKQVANTATIISKLGATTTGWEFTQYDPSGTAGDGLTVYLINSWTGNAIQAYSDNVVSANNWNYVCFTYNGSSNVAGIRIYVNGVSKTVVPGVDTLSLTILNNNPVTIGSRGSSLFYNGSIDEIRIWNRSLTASEIYQQYTSNLQKFNQTDWYLYVNQSINSTSTLTNGTYSYQTFVTDIQGNSNQTETRIITIDSVNPNATLISPQNNSLSNSSSNNFTANISDNLGLKNATLNIYNSSNNLVNQSNISYSPGTLSSTVGIVVTLVDGFYKWFYQILDYAGNLYTTGNYTLTIDSTHPQINFTFPTPANGTTTINTSFIINLSLSEPNLANLTYNWNGTNYTMYNDSLVLMMNFENLSSLGENSTYAVDVSKYGNNGTLTGAIWTSTAKYGKALQFNGSTDYIDLGATPMFDYSKLTVCTWIKTSSNSAASRIVVGGGTNTNKWILISSNGAIVITDGSTDKNSTILVNDSQWHHVCGLRNPYQIYIDGVNRTGITTGGSWTLGTNAMMGAKSNSQFFFNGTLDEVRIWNYSLSYSEIYQQYISNLNKFNSTQWYWYVNQSQNATTDLTDGLYNYQVFATDTFSNTNQTEKRFITISSDANYPIFSNYSDNNASITSGGIALFNITILNTNGSVWLTINGTNYTASNLTTNVYNVSIVGLANGTYSYNWSAYGNGTNHFLNISNTKSYTINSTIIQIGLSMIYPITNINVTQNQFFNVTVNVSCSQGNCSVMNISLYYLTNSSSSSSIFGDGSDGSLSASSANTLVNNYTYLNLNESAGDSNININSSSAFSAGDEILIIQMQNYSAGVAGNYEFSTISSVSGNDLILNSALVNSYYSGSFNRTNATVTQVVRVPQYTNVTISSGASITSSSWNGYSGGIVVFRANGFVNVTGSINVSTRGFRGGKNVSGVTFASGQQGESYTGMGMGPEATLNENNINIFNANQGGGGGGGSNDDAGDNTGGGGGGGSYGTNGTNCTYTNYDNHCGAFGNTYGDMNLTQIYLGSGGGGGGTENGVSAESGAGGSGGGIIIVFAGNLTLTGNIQSNGENGYSYSGSEDGSGGGGSGGSIYLYGNNITLGTNLTNSSGGIGPICGYGGASDNKGGNGGYGRIRIYYANISGATVPAYNGSVATISGSGSASLGSLINITAGAIPLYTNSSTNPISTSSLSAGQSQIITFFLNATGNISSNYTIFASANLTSNMAIGNMTAQWNVTIVSGNTGGCINLSNSGTYGGKLTAVSGYYNVTQNITLCYGIYNTTQDMFRVYSPNIVINCNNSVLIGDQGNNDIGIEIFSKENITIINCNISNFYDGIRFNSANRGILINNTLNNNSNYGLYLDKSNNLSINNNNLTDNKLGYYIDSSSSVNFTNNSIIRSKQYGMWMKGSTSYSYIYNNFFNNSQNIKLDASDTNYWNITNISSANIVNGSYLGGNYYTNPTGSDFSDTCDDANEDGICDASYTIKNKNTDYRPLSKPDSNLPNVTIFNPGNNTFVNGNLTIQAIAFDTNGINNVLFQYKNSSINWTNLCNITTPDAGTNNQIFSCIWYTRQFSNSTQGYDIRAVAYDAAQNNATDLAHYLIDRSIPYSKDISVIYPSGQYYVRNGQNVILLINATDSEEVSSGINISIVDLTLLNNSGNTTMNFYSGSRQTSFWSSWNLSVNVDSTTGAKSLPIYIRDNATGLNNIRSSDRFYVQVDNTPPTYDSVSDTGPVYNNNEVSFSLNTYDNYLLAGYIFSSNISGVWANDTEMPLTGAAASVVVTKTPSTGNYSYIFYIRDNAGNLNSTAMRNFETLDNAPAFTINIYNQTDGIILNYSNINFTFSYYNGVANNCSFILNGNINSTLNSPANSTILRFNATLTEGLHFWNIECFNNNTNETVQGNTRTLIVDTLNPQISISYPTASNYSSLVTQIEFSYIENNIYGCWYSLNNGVTNSSLIECSNITGISSSEGTNNWIVYIKDLANNVNSSSVIFISDISNPNATLLTPSNNTVSSNLSYNFTANISDNLGIKNATLIIYNSSNNIVNQTNVSFNQGTLTSTIGIFVTLVQGVYKWFYQIFDFTGNQFTTQNNTLNIDILYPVFSNYSDNNGTLLGRGIGLFNVTIVNTNGTVFLEINNTNITASNLTANVYNVSYSFNQNKTYSYRWHSWGNGNSNLYNVSEERTYNVLSPDLINPSISFGSLTTSSGNVSQSSITIQIIASDSHLTNVTAYLYNNSGIVNISSSSSSFTLIFSNLSDGVYYINATANDSSGNSNKTETRTIVLDTLAPNIVLYSPINGFNTTNSSQSFIFNATDNNQMNCSLMMDWEGYVSNRTVFSNSTIISGTNTTINSNLENRTYYWFINCSDPARNSNISSIRRLTVDQIPPSVIINSPANNSIVGFNVYIYTEISDSIIGVDTVNYYLFNSSNLSQTLTTGKLNSTNNWDAVWNSSSYGEIEANVTFKLTANDSLGNNYSINYSILLDNVNPSIQIIEPPSYLKYYNMNFTLNAIVQDLTLNYSNYSINSTTKQNSTSYNPVVQLHIWNDSINIFDMADNIYNLSVFARDGASNSKTSSINFYIDKTPPTVIVNYPTINLKTNATSINFNWSVTDNLAASLYCNLSIDGRVIKSNVLCLNGSECNYTIHGLTWADYYYNITCIDNASNVNSPQTNRFTPDWKDNDEDEVHNYVDRLIGNKTNVIANGTTNLNIIIGGSDNLTTFNYTKEVDFYDNSKLIINFSYNFTQGILDLNNVSIKMNSSYVLINLSNQLQGNKTVYIDDNNFRELCVKDSEISDISEMSQNCNESAEINFTNCIGNSTGLNLNEIICADEGTRIKIDNLQHSAIRGIPGETSSEPVSNTGNTPASTGGSIKIIRECLENKDCKKDYVCYKNKCVKLFDIKVVDIQSPVSSQGFFNVTYFMKGMANFSGDVVLKFWVEKNGNRTDLGQDVIYLGNFESKTEKITLFLPSYLEGVYDFYVEVEFEKYNAKSFRKVEILKKAGVTEILDYDNNGKLQESKTNNNWMFIIGVIFLMIIIMILFIIIILKRNKKSEYYKNPLNKISPKNYDNLGIDVFTSDGINIGKLGEVCLMNGQIYGWEIILDEQVKYRFEKERFLMRFKDILNMNETVTIKQSFQQLIDYFNPK